MEVVLCAQEVRNHAVSLLANLNLQREKDQFCDCVLRQRDNPGQLYPAHRCVLAASSPVLASILSSAGILVELQAPCLSDSVLAPLLDYVYTGALPYTHSQQLYQSLRTAAGYLQMDELKEALSACQQIEVKAVDNADIFTGAENKGLSDTDRKTVNTYDDLPSTSSIEDFRRLDETHTSSVQNKTTSLDREAHQYSAHVEARDEAQVHSVSTDSSKEVETDASGNGSKNSAKHCSKTVATPLNNVSTDLPVLGSIESDVNAGNYRKVTYLTLQGLIQKIPSTAEEQGMSEVDKDAPKDQFPSAGIVNPEILQKSTEEEELVRTTVVRRRSSSSKHAYCEAVPVICHSSRAAILQPAEVAAVSPHQPLLHGSLSSCGTPVLRSASTENDRLVEITTECKNQYGAQTHCNTGLCVTQGQDYRDRLNQCATQDLCYKSNEDRSNLLKRDYSSSSTHHLIMQNDEHLGSGLPHITHRNYQHDHYDSLQSNTKHLRHDSMLHNRNADLSIEDFPSKYQRLNSFECYSVSDGTATEEHSQDQRTVFPLPGQDSDNRSDSHCEDLCPEGEVKEEHSYFSSCPAEMDVQDSQCDLYGPKTNWLSNTCIADTKHVTSIQHNDDSNIYTAMENKEHIDLGLPVSITPESSLDNVTGHLSPSECHTSLEPENISGTVITEPHLTFTVPVDSDMSGSMYSAVGPSYRGHLHYHCLPQDNTQLLHGGCDHKHSQPHSDHSAESGDEEEGGTFANTSDSPLKRHFATETTDQVLLLDISTKPAELLLSCRQSSDTEEKRGRKKDSLVTGVRNHNRALRNIATSVAGSFVEAETKSWVEQTGAEERRSVGKDQSRQGAENIQAGVVEVDSHDKEGQNQIRHCTVCSPPTVSESVQGYMLSTLSVGIPSTLSASMATNKAAHLSTPVNQPFQCSLCDRSFSQRGSLNRHMRSHLGVRPFPCPRCPMTFSRQYRVTEHMRVHQRCVLGNGFQKPTDSSI